MMQARSRLMVLMRSLDWPLIAVIAGFALVAPIPGAANGSLTSPLLWVAGWLGMQPFATYQSAVAAAAVKRPHFQKTLATIAATSATVNVVTFRTVRELPPKDRSFEIWVGLRDQVRDACAGATDPVHRLQQILGLPPVAAENNVVTELEVPRDGLFRPCVGRSDIGKPTCEFELPDAPPLGADAEALRGAYNEMRFVTKQMWESYRIGFTRASGSPADYPYTGYPFTGMGWSYDWTIGPHDHLGISEFVIKRDAVIKLISDKKPAEFCAKSN